MNDTKPGQIITLKISLNLANGQLDVSGPMTDGILFLGMLEMAKTIFSKLSDAEKQPVKPKPNIIVPTLNPPPMPHA